MNSHVIAEIFPLMEGDEFQSFVADIRQHGLHEPIVLYDGTILDGRNRYGACIEAGVKPRFETYDGEDAVGYVVSLNLRRRHMNEGQRADVAAKLANMPLGGAAYRSANLQSDGISQSDAAALFNVSTRSVASAVAVRDHGVPELQRVVERGQASVSAAADVATQPPETARILSGLTFDPFQCIRQS